MGQVSLRSVSVLIVKLALHFSTCQRTEFDKSFMSLALNSNFVIFTQLSRRLFWPEISLKMFRTCSCWMSRPCPWELRLLEE